jgi:hypothetical protein
MSKIHKRTSVDVFPILYSFEDFLMPVITTNNNLACHFVLFFANKLSNVYVFPILWMLNNLACLIKELKQYACRECEKLKITSHSSKHEIFSSIEMEFYH